jgi:competence protein ComFC
MLIDHLRKWLGSGIAGLAPRACFGCRRWNLEWLCDTCRSDASVLNWGERETVSPDRAWSAAIYSGIFKNILHQAKYGATEGACRAVFEILLQGSVPPEWKQSQAIVPVPGDFNRISSRGFNQSEILAQIISRKINVPVQPCVTRTHGVPPLHNMNRIQRAEVLKELFCIRDGFRLSQDRILVVDDILTTGATLGAMTRVLKENGVKTVWAAVLCHVPG